MMEEITFVIRFEGRPPAISANTEVLGGKITEVYFGNALYLKQETGGYIVRYKDAAGVFKEMVVSAASCLDVKTWMKEQLPDCEIISVVKE